MNWAAGFSWLAALGERRLSPHAGEDDRAGMGTAFGLDASFGPPHDEPAAGAGDAPEPPPWSHRLTRRSSL